MMTDVICCLGTVRKSGFGFVPVLSGINMSGIIAYTREDKEILISILKEHKIIENKASDATTIKAKGSAWVEIMKEYNFVRPEKRTVIQLKSCWDKIKRQHKVELAEERRSRMATGGGEGMKNKQLVPGVELVAPHIDVEVPNNYDSDAQYLNKDHKCKSGSPLRGCLFASKAENLTFEPTGDLTIDSNNKPSTSLEQPACSDKQNSKSKSTPKTRKATTQIERLMEIKIENALLERKQLIEILEKVKLEKELLKKKLLQ